MYRLWIYGNTCILFNNLMECHVNKQISETNFEGFPCVAYDNHNIIESNSNTAFYKNTYRL